ncbi:NAD-dependent epimerase/dehydratase family protein [Staphylococcus gallinarum]|uniref:NAD-dependent epimerase/dehydratase family protein n=1 Tax=Staphylococcus gallinarum TaxID=1293 RepID=UPI001E3C551A|nr:NAD-dependent epimerase/dehydratase family protein [Staphylococcus gallinarum]MCD8909797.1 NAD-dependent epimerase/dehydratase family protein [Staphylococcus gallinarum]
MSKKILLTGKNGYVGNHLENYLVTQGFIVERISLKNNDWKKLNFEQYEAVIHLAALVHNNMPNAKIVDYFKINYHLTRQLAEKSKADGVKQFIFFSTMSVFGLNGALTKKIEIKNDTPCNPQTNYGYSKYFAEKAINAMKSHEFIVNIVRPPMIYGEGSPGNFSNLIKIAKIMPVYPKIKNDRSVIYIDNLCKHILSLIYLKVSKTTHPQNIEYMCTNDVLSILRKQFGKRTIEIPIPKLIVNLIGKINIAKKIYGNLMYAKDIDEDRSRILDYTTLEDSIKKTVK